MYKDKIFITTPIYYVNDRPHVGHTFTTLLADVYAQYYRKLLGSDEVFFLTGTDEHGIKVSQAAQKNNLTPREYTNMISNEYKSMWKELGITYDYFIRTTNPVHKRIVQKLLEDMYLND